MTALKRFPRSSAITGRNLDDYFTATVDAAEEAVIASMINATTTSGYKGNTLHALPLDEVRAILQEHR